MTIEASVSAGIARNNAFSAARPPADAPTPMTGISVRSSRDSSAAGDGDAFPSPRHALAESIHVCASSEADTPASAPHPSSVKSDRSFDIYALSGQSAATKRLRGEENDRTGVADIKAPIAAMPQLPHHLLSDCPSPSPGAVA
ncbi:hypothetical protein L1787_07260 [Acuticoccus sp. M5D2P5]|uniref:hypothetical protein n=1 Tax=Acuticoccus kalidii TaxID=2910977 RepID=UPI001F42EC06|nr:hypothetical protein [Acuticoccus kalidii]MCF3933209.1 hypothetical protein [Acuticoccus kalidii]